MKSFFQPADPSQVDPAIYGAVAILSICITVFFIVESLVAAWKRRRRAKLARELWRLYQQAERGGKNNSTK